MNDIHSLSNQFLIAMPSLNDANFSRSVTYICQHDEHGALGIVINQPLELTLGDVLSDLELSTEQESIRNSIVFLGGPVQRERGFVLHYPVGEWEATLNISDQMGLTASRSILASIAKGQGPKNNIVVLGYAGWAAGQLEQEMLANSWLSGPADNEIIFNLPIEERWQAAATCAGVDITRLSSEAGHA
ncbi:MAG: YqgE/AlgH family protein [Gammaproteobacteria bacterium]|nr:YqgE/AlgH family protein [Gammaproteobacteria bacterium]PCH63858.1 MAG: YqgE/AlgH family protein [Gammaproteobacteria bacterium]